MLTNYDKLKASDTHEVYLNTFELFYSIKKISYSPVKSIFSLSLTAIVP